MKYKIGYIIKDEDCKNEMVNSSRGKFRKTVLINREIRDIKNNSFILMGDTTVWIPFDELVQENNYEIYEIY